MREIFTPQYSGEYLCAFASLSSALWFINDVDAYKTIFSNMGQSLEQDPFALAMALTSTRNLKYTPKMYTYGQSDILQERSPFVTLAQLMASDGCSLHCVATVGNALFDANANTILELTQENLDWCCSTDKENSKYVGVLRACRFIHENPRPLWRTYGIKFDYKKKEEKRKASKGIDK